jgi:membrane protease subunit HflK
MIQRRSKTDGLVMEALLYTLRHLTVVARVLALVLLALHALSGVRIVPPHQSALVLRFGKLQPQVHGPGLLIAWPKPIDEVILTDSNTEHILVLDAWAPLGPRVEGSGEPVIPTDAELQAHFKEHGGNMPAPERRRPDGDWLDPVSDGYTLTGDWNIVQGRFALRYRISDPAAYFLAGPEAGAMLSALACRAVAHHLGRIEIDHALSEGRDKLSSSVVERIRQDSERLRLGIEPAAFELRELSPPRQVYEAFEDVVSAKLYAKTLTENAQEYHSRQTTEAQGQANAIRQRAQAFSQQLVATAEGEARSFIHFHTEFQRNPRLVASRLYAETLDYLMRQANSSTLLPADAVPPSVVLEPAPDHTR